MSDGQVICPFTLFQSGVGEGMRGGALHVHARALLPGPPQWPQIGSAVVVVVGVVVVVVVVGHNGSHGQEHFPFLSTANVLPLV